MKNKKQHRKKQGIEGRGKWVPLGKECRPHSNVCILSTVSISCGRRSQNVCILSTVSISCEVSHRNVPIYSLNLVWSKESECGVWVAIGKVVNEQVMQWKSFRKSAVISSVAVYLVESKNISLWESTYTLIKIHICYHQTKVISSNKIRTSL